MLIGGSIAAAAGQLAMMGFLAKAPAVSVGLLIVLMVITQTVVTVVYQLCMDKNLSMTRCLGFIFAGIAIILLNKK